MKKIFTQYNFYTFLWCLYYLQGVLYAEGGIVSRSLLVLFLLLSLFYFAKALMEYSMPSFLKVLGGFVFLVSIYGLSRLFVDDTTWIYSGEKSSFLKTYLISILPIFSFYYFTRKGWINDRWFSYIFILFFITVFLTFQKEEGRRMATSSLDGVTNNSGYLFLSLLPLTVLLKKRRIIQYFSIFAILFFIIQSMKRGAILLGIVASLFELLSIITKASKKERAILSILTILLLIVTVVFSYHFINASDYFYYRIEQTLEGDMSNRETMYPLYFRYFQTDMNPLTFVFGNGADGTLKLFGDYAHNDWIEIAIDLGFVGVLFYLAYWIGLLRFTFAPMPKKTMYSYRLIMILFVIIYLGKSVLSMSINSMPLIITSIVGYSIALLSHK